MPDDPFGTAGIRERVLAAWSASPARFREDANAEQDLTHGAYRDRLPVELAVSWELESERAARSLEWRIKQLTRTQKLALVGGAPLPE